MDDKAIYDIYVAARGSAALALAVHVGLFDWFGEETRSARDVCERFGWAPRPADGFLTALAALGLLDRRVQPEPDRFFDPGDVYTLTPAASRFLVPGRPEDLSGLIAMEFEAFVTPSGLLEAMKRNAPQVYGDKDPWDMHEEDAERARNFAKGMRSISSRPAKALVEESFWSDRRKLLDVGGGSGIFAVEALLRWPKLHATVFEIPAVCPLAAELAGEHGVADRLTTAPGNMFQDPWPKGCDVLLLSQILHDWPPDKGATLLAKAFDALDPGGLVLIHEKLLDTARKSPVANALVTLDMLFWTEGQQYSEAQLRALLTAAGFRDVNVIRTVGYWSVTIARKR